MIVLDRKDNVHLLPFDLPEDHFDFAFLEWPGNTLPNFPQAFRRRQPHGQLLQGFLELLKRSSRTSQRADNARPYFASGHLTFEII